MPATATMRAERIHAFGGPEVLHLEEVEQPRPDRREILVRIYAAGVNPVDWKIREGKLGTVPLPSIIGSDFSGVVDPVTLDFVRWAAANVKIPWFAIGGINLENLDAVLAAGAQRVCVVSAILNADDIATACRKFKQRL